MNIDTAELEKAVVAQAVQALVDQYSDPESEIATQIHEQAKAHIIRRVDMVMQGTIHKVIEDGLEKIVFPCTNIYGEEKNPPQTLREFIASMTESVFTEYLDNDGKPTGDNWYKKPENQRVNKIIKEAVENKIRDEVTVAAQKMQAHITHYLGEFVKVQLQEAAARFK